MDLAEPADPPEPAKAASPLPQQDIRFCTTDDGVKLAYSVVGQGYPVLKMPNWLTHLEFDWSSPVWRHWSAELAQDYRLVRYDQRGCGLSDWSVEDFSFEARTRDLETIVNAVGFEEMAIIGISQSGPIAVRYAVEHPEKVSHLILCGAYAKGWAHRGSTSKEDWEATVTLTKNGWGRDDAAFQQMFTSMFMPGGTPEHMRWFNDLQRVSTSADNAVSVQRSNADVDIVNLLPKVTVPTLVMHSRGDAMVPFDSGRELASLIPGARFVPLDSNNHLVIATEPAWQTCLVEIRRFLDESA